VVRFGTRKYIAVDLDGVVFVKFRSTGLAVLARAIGVQEALLRDTMTERANVGGLYDRFRCGGLNSEEYWEWFFGALGGNSDARGVFLETLCSLRECDFEVGRLLEGLRARGLRTAVFSNNYPDNVASLDSRFGLRSRFDALVFSFEIGVLKPHPEFYARAADRLGVQPSEVVVVDDSAANICAAEEMGMDGILFRGAKELYRELLERGLAG